jgi:adenine phosphoribosyltransferase
MKSGILKLSVCVSLLAVLPSIGSAQVSGDCSWIQNYLTPVPDFPQPGVQFQWYANLLKDPKAFRAVIQTFAKRYKDSNLDAIAGLDSRGFIFGAAVAYELEVPFVMIRKPGKLPRAVERIDYSLEYGKTSFEIEIDSLNANDRVVIIDDVLATGGTARAAKELVERLGAQVVEAAFLIELPFLDGRKKVAAPVYSLISVEGE